MTKQLLKPSQLHDYQRECVMHQLQHDDSMLWLQMGLGKTPITLTTIVDRMRAGHVKKVLIFGPLRVIQAVWAREARKWEHTKHLRFSVMHGSAEKRERALFADADIYLCNYENMNWLAEKLLHYYTPGS
jgi:ERCC4-related helicase